MKVDNGSSHVKQNTSDSLKEKRIQKLRSYERADQNSFGGTLNLEKANHWEFQWMHFLSILKKLSNITVLANDEADQLYSSHDFFR